VPVSHGPLQLTESGGVAVVTIDHPPTNLVDGPFIVGLMGLLDALEAGAAHVVVFRSADPDFFLMHGDVRAILASPQGRYRPASSPNAAAATFQRLAAGPIVTIGMVDGAARGGGAEFLTCLDFRFGTPRTVLGQPEVAMGILPGAGGTARLPRMLGRSRALDVILSGRDVHAEEALRIGWLDALIPPADIEAHTMGFAARIASMPASSVAAAKAVVDTSLTPITAALVAETDAYGRLTADGVHEEPMRRFLEAGGQTREGETARMDAVMAATLEP
jgi:enoyl-CoA hydratase/carnithine racemase